MRRSRLTRQLMATTLPIALIAGSGIGIATADPMLARNMSTYGMPGGIDNPLGARALYLYDAEGRPLPDSERLTPRKAGRP